MTSDPMHVDIDDFINADSAATPSGNSPPQPPSKPTAIPIKSRKNQQQQQQHQGQFVPQSVPVTPHLQESYDEFDYVQRHYRKTSIDERRVSFGPYSFSLSLSLSLYPFVSLYSVFLPTIHLVFSRLYALGTSTTCERPHARPSPPVLFCPARASLLSCSYRCRSSTPMEP